MKSWELVTQSRKKLTNDNGSVSTTDSKYPEILPQHNSILKSMTIILYIHKYTEHVWAQCSLPQIWIMSEGLSRHATTDHSLLTSSAPGQARTQNPALQSDSLGWRRTMQLISMPAQLFLHSSPPRQRHDIQTQTEGYSSYVCPLLEVFC